MKKWIALAVYAAAFVLAFAYRHELAGWLTAGPPLWLLFVLSALFAVFPVMPYRLVIAAAGFAAGAFWGGFVTLIGSTLAGAVYYWGAAYGWGNAARGWSDRFKPLERITAAIDRRPFIAIVVCKLIPILPQTAVNMYAGAYGIRFRVYLAASVVGKLPGVFFYAFLGASLFNKPWVAAGAIAVYMLFIFAILALYKRWAEI
ncbi:MULTISPECIES: TVP38/TMEM64 family protein [Paenibacillus]|uniref:TVP38/TMEM64 family protein n=1 Tax=Paenibacillus TaxID=44249 RepID=UPI002FE36640